MIYLYHLANSKKEYELILKNGLKSGRSLGNPVPTFFKTAQKVDDIFFHPLRENESLNDLPYSSIESPDNVYFVAIALPLGSGLQVNNRLYSFGTNPLELCDIDEYCKSDKYKSEGLPECRIKIPHIPPEYLIMHGTITEPKVEKIIEFPLSLENYRFQAPGQLKSEL